jgi:hypothetical protein
MAKRRLTPKQKQAGVKRSREISSGDTVAADEVRWLSSEIWEKPWIDFDALITKRLDTLRAEDERRGDQESNYTFSDQLSVEFPSEFNRICKLIQDAMTNEAPPAMDDLKTIQLNLSLIVYRHRNRHSRNSRYLDRIHRGIQSAEAAADHLDKIVDLLINLDAAQRDVFMYTVNKLSLGRYADTIEDFVRHVLEAQLTMRLFSRTLHISTSEPFEPRRKGRPRVQYVSAAFDLIRLWESLTCQRAVYPKGSAEGEGGEYEAVQPSTEFIRLALKMIDPDITNAQVITCLKYAFEINKRVKDNPYTREYLIPPPIMDVILAGGSASDVEEAFVKYGREIASRINPGKSA